jgi:hypothetical protein
MASETVKLSDQLLEMARADTDAVLKKLGSQVDGLSEAEAAARLKQVGPNAIAREHRQSPLMRLLDNVKNPLVLLLVALGVHGDGINDAPALKQDSVHPKPGQLGADRHVRHYRLGRRLADGFTLGRHAWLRPAPVAVLAAAGDHAAGLRDPDPGGQDLVLPQVWRMSWS